MMFPAIRCALDSLESPESKARIACRIRLGRTCRAGAAEFPPGAALADVLELWDPTFDRSNDNEEVLGKLSGLHAAKTEDKVYAKLRKVKMAVIDDKREAVTTYTSTNARLSPPTPWSSRL